MLQKRVSRDLSDIFLFKNIKLWIYKVKKNALSKLKNISKIDDGF